MTTLISCFEIASCILAAAFDKMKNKSPVIHQPFRWHMRYAGCFLLLIAALSSCTQKSTVTFSNDVAPIIYAKCTKCHRPGQPAPFTLISYKDVAKRSKTIRKIINLGIMPPWPADATYRHFLGENQLSAQQISIINQWVDAGAPLGDTSNISRPPHFPAGSMIGKPDLRLKIKPYLVKGDNTDRFMVMKIPFELPADTFISAIEFVPGSNLVHHVNGRIIFYDSDRKADVFAGDYALDTKDETRESVFSKMNLLNDDGSYPGNDHYIHSATNYLPGAISMLYPEGIGGFFVRKKGIIYLNDIHYGPSGEDVLDTSFVNIFFSATPPKRPVQEIQLGTLGISDIIPSLVIPPDTVMTFVTRARILGDISLLTINPHMHLLGKSFIAYALQPNGDTIPLIRIRHWDFRWQYFYTFEKMLHIPAGSTIEVVAVMDNTRNNPNNPHHPPQQVEGRNGSMRTTDEMLQLILTYLPYQHGDENISLNTQDGSAAIQTDLK